MKSSIVSFFAKYSNDDKIKQYWMGGACSTYKGDDKCVKNVYWEA
jgi:hypothetical protein